MRTTPPCPSSPGPPSQDAREIATPVVAAELRRQAAVLDLPCLRATFARAIDDYGPDDRRTIEAAGIAAAVERIVNGLNARADELDGGNTR